MSHAPDLLHLFRSLPAAFQYERNGLTLDVTAPYAKPFQTIRLIYTMDDLVTAYLNHLRAKRQSDQTVSTRAYALSKLTTYLRRHQITRFQDVTVPRFRAYRADISERNYSESTIAVLLCGARHFFDYLSEAMLIFDNPARFDVIGRPRQRRYLILTPEQVNDLINAATDSYAGTRNRAMLEVLYSTAVRKSELLAIKLSDLSPDTVRITGEGNAERIVPLGRTAIAAVSDYLRIRGTEPGHLWLTQEGNTISVPVVDRMFDEYRRRAGIAGNVSAHTLRRSCATHLIINGAAPQAVANLLGHKHLQTLSSYVQLTIAELKAMHENSRLGQ